MQLGESARKNNLPEIAALFDNIGGMSGPQIGAKVIAAITLLQEKPEHQVMSAQLSMIAMNLKNLK